jgi:hypothetical protein
MNYLGHTRCIQVSNKQIAWKKLKGKIKIGIVITNKIDRYEYIHDFNTHSLEYERYNKALGLEKSNEREQRIEEELVELFAKLFKQNKKEGEH